MTCPRSDYFTRFATVLRKSADISRHAATRTEQTSPIVA